ncbi:unnamed protein product [Closterium sp. NIES-65]|nr:unnamed protein product [Closterium sp. NIES-65]
MAAYQIAVVALLLGLALPFVLAGNAKGAETSSQSNYNYDANGNIILSTAGNNNQNGNGKGTSADVIDWYNDQEYPTCPLKACPPFKHYCSGGMCNDTAGILGRWRLPEQSSLVCPPGRANPKPNNDWCVAELTPSQCCKACSESKESCAMWQHYIGEGQAKRAMDYNTLAHALGRPVAADAAEGAGFLDGETADYESTSVLAADCRFSAFHGKALLLPRTQ